ncbi:MAG TPA: heavy-metal-associated domain-containing protein [Anaerolineales bacterium]|nr:heavy-metal-associated domain-containing protein [Anaerolineales bacterium]
MDENCYVEPIQKNATAEERQKIEKALFVVWGMGCPNCAARVRNSLLLLNGVVNAYVDHTAGVAGVIYNPELATVEMLISAIARAGNDGRHEYGARLLS